MTFSSLEKDVYATLEYEVNTISIFYFITLKMQNMFLFLLGIMKNVTGVVADIHNLLILSSYFKYHLK